MAPRRRRSAPQLFRAAVRLFTIPLIAFAAVAWLLRDAGFLGWVVASAIAVAATLITLTALGARLRRRARAHSAPFLARFERLTTETFDTAIGSDEPLVVDFWADWYVPCHALAPKLAEVADELSIRVATLDVDANREIAERLDVRGIPTLIVFRQGRELERIPGNQPKEEIVAKLTPHLV